MTEAILLKLIVCVTAIMFMIGIIVVVGLICKKRPTKFTLCWDNLFIQAEYDEQTDGEQ